MGEVSKKELKKAIYIILWGLVGGLFAICIAGLVEYMSYQILNELDLEVVLYGVMIFVGVLAGLFVGPIAWKKIYVEGLRGKKYIAK